MMLMFETRVEKKNTLNEKRFPFSIELSEVIEWGEIKQSNKNIYIYIKTTKVKWATKKRRANKWLLFDCSIVQWAVCCRAFSYFIHMNVLFMLWSKENIIADLIKIFRCCAWWSKTALTACELHTKTINLLYRFYVVSLSVVSSDYNHRAKKNAKMPMSTNSHLNK